MGLPSTGVERGEEGVRQRAPLRIALVITSLRAGGAERVLSTLANYWSHNRQEVSLITLDTPESDFFAVDATVDRVVVDREPPALNSKAAVLGATLKRIRSLRRTLTRIEPDVIVSFGAVTNVLAILASRRTGFPIIISERSDPRHDPIGRVWAILRWLLYRRASTLVVQTLSVRSWARTIVQSRRIAVIPNPVMTTVETSPCSVRGDPSAKLTVIGMGRLSAEKGFDLLIRAFAVLRGRFPGWSLTIFGEGPARSHLDRLIQQLELEDVVTLPGITSAPELELQRAALFVLSSRYEGFPNVLLEAMAAGLPVIAANCPSGPAEIIEHGKSGMLVAKEDEDALARAMESLMSDLTTRRRLGSEAMREVQRFHLDRVMELWADLLDDVTRERRRST